MAGSNQASNLTGMLSQIGDTLGRDRDISGLTRNIENMSRPSIGADGEGMLRLADWQNQMGRAQEAAVTSRMMADQQTAVTAQQTAARKAAVDAYAVQSQELLRQRDVAIREGNESEISAIDAKLSNLAVPNADAMSHYKNVSAAIGDQDKVHATNRTNAGVDKFRRNEDEIARLRQDVGQPGPKGEAAAQRIAALESQNRQILQAPGVADAVKKIADTETAVAGNAEQRRVSDAEKKVWDAFSGPGGEIALEALLENNPELAQSAAGAIKEIREFKEEREKVLAEQPTVASNEALGKDIVEKYEAITGLKDFEKKTFKARVEQVQKQYAGLPDVARTKLMDLYTEAFKAASSVAGTERAATAGLEAEQRSLERSINTRTLSNSQLQAGADALPSSNLFTRALNAWDGGTFDNPQLIVIHEVARDQLRLSSGLPPKYKYDSNGKAVLDKNNQLIPADASEGPKTAADYLN